MNGWIVTNNGYILNTTNGGDNWNVQLDSAGNFYSIQFIQDNTFNGPSDTGICLYLKNSSISVPPQVNVDPEGEATGEPSPYLLNLVHNNFTGGNYSVVLVNFAQHYLGYLIKDNTFNSANFCNMLLRQSEGSLKK